MQKHLMDAIFEVMETMFFLPVQFSDGTNAPGPWLSGESGVQEATIEFEGARSGRVFLLVPENALKEMAANLLGLDEEDVSGEQVKDTLKEAINMVTGRMLSMVDRDGQCRLRIPRFGGLWKPAELEKSPGHGFFLFFETGKNRLAAGLIESET